MRLTTRGRYAVTALLDLAIQNDEAGTAVSLSDIAQRQSISISYLEQLFSKLRKNGLVTSTRGASGGYHLAKPLDEIDVMSIVTAVDESVNAMQCGGSGDCQGGAMCLTHDLWCALSNHIQQYLQSISLAQVLEMKNVKDISRRQVLLSQQETGEEVSDKASLASKSQETGSTSFKVKSSKTVKSSNTTEKQPLSRKDLSESNDELAQLITNISEVSPV